MPFATVEPYVRTVAKQLTPAGRHWEFDVIADDAGGRTFEPVVFPGYVFVPVKLLLMTGSEAELAGMLAHAAAHLLEPPAKVMVSSRDDTRRPGLSRRRVPANWRRTGKRSAYSRPPATIRRH